MKNKYDLLRPLSLTASSLCLAAIPMLAADAEGEAAKKPSKKEKPMNVLFIASDDMRADLSVYGNPVVYTPNIDKLASQGIRFDRAYCQYPLSGPSRSSLLSGRYPTTSHLYSNGEWFGATYPEWESLPMYFKNRGYVTWRTGKIFHGGFDDTDAWDEGGDPRRSNNPVNLAPPSYVSIEQHRAHVNMLTMLDKSQAAHSDRWAAIEGEEAANHGDTRSADRAIAYLQRAKDLDEPFFIACGFSKPHSPLIAPNEFFDIYEDVDIELPVDFATMPMVPRNFPGGSIRENTADLFISRPATPEQAKDMIKAYLACISFVDWNVGRVLAELDRQGLRENTIIVFWADHGYQLGEKGKWSKAGSLWEQGIHVPLIIVDPRNENNGQVSYRPVELIDMYPTLAELCGLPFPEGVDGDSLVPLLNDPDAEWDKPAFSVWNEHGKGVTGISVRTQDWHYAEFFGIGAGAFLIDPKNDPHELNNLVHDPQYKDVVNHLHKLAMEHLKGEAELSAPLAQ